MITEYLMLRPHQALTWLYCREVLMIFLDLLVKRVGNIPDRAAQRIGLFPQ